MDSGYARVSRDDQSLDLGLACRCGFVHDLTPAPGAGAGWVTLREADEERFTEAHLRMAAIAGRGLPGHDEPRAGEWDAAMRLAVGAKGRLYECPRCGRLMWAREGSDRFVSFLPEGPEQSRG